jgi:hypothetical protein
MTTLLPDLSSVTDEAELVDLLNKHYGARWLEFDEGAALVSANYFHVSPRSLERWNLPFIVVNGRRCSRPKDYVDAARRLIAAAERKAAERSAVMAA